MTKTNLKMKDAMRVITAILENACEIVTIYSASLGYGSQNTRTRWQNLSSHSTADKHQAF